jgi:NADPH-dependent glutamate synthase beta subunit-like oxidoreductase
MPASAEDVADTEREGIRVYPARTATRILRAKGAVTGVEFLEVASFGFDDDRNVQIEARADSQHILPADQVIFAIGQRPDIPAGFGLDVSPRQLFEVDPVTLQTSREGVFAAGDAVTGTASVIKAIASGRKAAISVDRFLGGSGDIDTKLAPDLVPEWCLGKKDSFAAMPRFAGALDVSTADYEADRCLQCDLRLDIKPVKFWGSY